MGEHWTSHRFSLGNPRSDGADDLPRLLRRLAQEIEDRAIQPMEIGDLTLAQEITEDGPWFSATLYWTPEEEGTPPEGPQDLPNKDTAVSDPVPGGQVRVPVADALPGVQLYPLPVDETVVAAFSMIKTRDLTGEANWYTRTTYDHNRIEFLGALTAYVDHLRAEEASGWSEDDDAPHSHADIDT